MAPKKHVRLGPSRQQPQQPHPLIYVNAEADAACTGIGSRPIVQERTMAIVSPQREYIKRHGWTTFMEAGMVPTSRSLVQEFHSNLAGQRADLVFVRGREVDISAEAINRFYSLQDIPADGYTAIAQQEPFSSVVSAALTRTPDGMPAVLPPDCHTISRGLLTIEAKNWAYFVGARLMPVKIGSKIHRVRAPLVYAIVTGLTVDVGCFIQRELMMAAGGAVIGRSASPPDHPAVRTGWD